LKNGVSGHKKPKKPVTASTFTGFPASAAVGHQIVPQSGDGDDLRILEADWSMAKEYIEQRTGGYFIKDARVSLDSVVYAFLRGESPEGIADSFPALELEQIFGALAFYMANR
jgi:uncharacterized protein (DUF433 family)